MGRRTRRRGLWSCASSFLREPSAPSSVRSVIAPTRLAVGLKVAQGGQTVREIEKSSAAFLATTPTPLEGTNDVRCQSLFDFDSRSAARALDRGRGRCGTYRHVLRRQSGPRACDALRRCRARLYPARPSFCRSSAVARLRRRAERLVQLCSWPLCVLRRHRLRLVARACVRRSSRARSLRPSG